MFQAARRLECRPAQNVAQQQDCALARRQYRELIPEPRPGRSTVEAKLARPDILVEIEAIAVAD
jgi:enamine deaminase RidA (YjgF/YER057c/UK114 family)